jgi:isopentenyldiphosphate isomerase
MEYLDVVNEHDIVIGKASRKECHKDPNLIHRGTNVYIFDSEKLDRILRIKRSMTMDTEKGKWTILVGEHNQLGESYNKAAERGVKEELGVKVRIIREVSHILRRMSNQSEYHRNYIAIYDGDPKDLVLNEESEKAEFILIADLIEDMRKNRDYYVSYLESAFKVIAPIISK